MKKIQIFVLLSSLLITWHQKAYPAMGGQNHYPEEKIFVHTDRDLYVAGEKMFFSLWRFNQHEYRGPQSNFGYLALRSQGEVVEQLTLDLGKGFSSGSLYLHDTLSTGLYEIVAFTNWMKNHGETSFFRKKVFIANRFDKDLQNIVPEVMPDETLEISFFPEGENFIAGKENRILVAATGEFDSSNRLVYIVDQHQDTLKQTRLNQYGFGSFNMVPEASTAYHLKLDGAGKQFNFPQSHEKGVVLSVSENKNQFSVRIDLAEDSPSRALLKIKKQDRPVWEKAFLLDTAQVSISIPAKDLPGGILLFELTTEGNHHKASRYWFHQQDSPKITLSGKTQYNKREKVNLEILPELKPDEHAFVTVSVKKPFHLKKNPANPAFYHRNVIIANDLGIDYHHSEKRFGHLTNEELNQYLAGFSGKREKEVWTKRRNGSGFYMEDKKLIVSGMAKNPETKEPLQDVRVILNTPDSLLNLLYTHTDENGEFHFPLTDYYRSKELFFSIDPKSYEGPKKIEIVDKFDFYLPFDAKPDRSVWSNKQYINQSQDIVTVQKNFDVEYARKPDNQFFRISQPPMLYYKPNITVRTENYIPLDNLQEITRELVPVWRIRSSGDDFHSRLICGTTGNAIPDRPVYFLDGIITYDLNRLIHLGSEEIEKLEIHNFNWVHGEMTFPGIIGIFTKSEEYRNINAINGALASTFHQSTKHHKLFSAPTYETKTSGDPEKPDLRQLLFWQPELRINPEENQKIEFYTGDLTGDYLVTVQGMTTEGKPVHFKKTITVK